jgi:hypothetical protein
MLAKLTPSVLLGLFAIQAATGNDNANKAMTPAKHSFDTAIEAASKEYTKATDKARAEYAARLDKLIESATKAGNIDAALAIRDERRRLDSIAVYPPSRVADLEGIWEIRYTNKSVRIYIIDRDGRIKAAAKDGKNRAMTIRAEGDNLLARDGSIVERFKIDGGRLIIEHYNPSSGAVYGKEDPPDCVGFGKRTDRK